MNKQLIKNIKSILEANPSIDLYWVPRVNTVEGLTQEHIQKWGWQVNDKGWVNFPDYQGRIWRNRQNIRWEKPVHEILTGHKEHTFLPQEEQFCFYHHKEIEKQEKHKQREKKTAEDGESCVREFDVWCDHTITISLHL